ncbi:MAG: 50S ribosomal protein L25 [Candidatus Omnitrophota bacterium]
MEKINITVNSREEKGKEAAGRIRKKGFIPAVVYSGDFNTILSIPSQALKVLRSVNFSESVIIDMEISGSEKLEPISVFIKDIQYNPLNEDVIHIDFLKVSLKEKIRVHIPIVLKGEPESVKAGEGVIDQILREVEIEAFPLDIPKEIEVDVSALTIGHSLHAADLKAADNIKIVTDPQETIVTISVKKEEEAAEDVVPEEGAASSEPEVIKEKKEAPQAKAKEGK